MANTLTNTSDTVIAQAALEAFIAAVTPIKAFSLNASPDPAARGDKVKVLSVPAQDAAIPFVGANGYVMQDADASGVDVSLTGHEYVSWALSDIELKNNPQLEMQRFGRAKGFQLSKKVLQTIWADVTESNFGDGIFVAASGFDYDEVVALGAMCDSADWPETDRSLILKPAYHAALRASLKDSGIFGSSEPIRQGVVPSVDVFSAVYKTNLIPANGEALEGFAVHPNAILVAMRYLAPQAGHKYAEASALTDPESGLTLGWRSWYDENSGQSRRVLECNFGSLVGNGNALKRIVSEAAYS